MTLDLGWRPRLTPSFFCLVLLLALVPPAAHAADVASYIASARQHLKQNDYRGAEIELRNALRDDPKNSEARVMLAKLYLDGGAPNMAIAELLMARQAGTPEWVVAPMQAEALYNRGRIGDLLKTVLPGKRPAHAESIVRTYRGLSQLSLGALGRAQADFTDAIKLDPNAAKPKVALARLYMVKQQPKNAEALVDSVLKQHPKDSDALDVKGVILSMRGDIGGGLVRFNQALAVDPDNLHATLDRASAYVSRNQLDKASADVQRVLDNTPESATANYISALISARRGKLQDADTKLQKLRDVMEQMPEAYFLAAIVKYNLNQLEQAEAFIRRFIAQRPGNSKGYELLGSIALRRGDAELASEMLKQAVKLAPSDVSAIGLLAEAEMARGNTEAAMALLNESISKQPNNTQLLTQRALGHMALGEEGQSLVELSQIYRNGKGNPLAGPPLVISALKAGKIDIASATAERLVQQDPENVFNQQLLGIVRMSQHNFPVAEEIFKKVLQKSPNLTAARKDLATIYVDTNRIAEAKKLFSDRLAADPSDFGSAEALADISIRQKDYAGAIAVFQTAQSAMANNPAPSVAILGIYARQKRWADAKRLANSIAAQFPNTEQLFDVLGTLYIQSGDIKTGVDTYKRATTSYPTSAHLWERYAAALAVAKNYPDSLDAISRAIALDPKEDSYKGELVSLTYQAKGADAALAAANAVQADSASSAATLQAADILEKQGKRGDAIALLQKALTARPSASVLLRLVGLYQDAGTLQPAIGLMTAWLKGHPEDLVIQLMLAESYGAVGAYDQAQANFEQLAVRRPSDAVILNNLAWLYARKNDPRALSIAQKAHQLAPDTPAISDTLGWILTSRNDAANGVKYLQSAVAAAPNDPSINFHYAVALSKLGKNDEARLVLQKILHGNQQFGERAAAEDLLKKVQIAKGR
ncbi:MAG: XrtA/PEP-CTERM system TPR-repeat protein PrsT [Rhizomicrobium sp.]